LSTRSERGAIDLKIEALDVAILEITKQQFGGFKLIEHCRSLWQNLSERAWFANTAGNLTGVVLQDPVSGLWSHNICRRGDDGKYIRVASGADFHTIDAARDDLIAKMQQLGGA
jgi:hypothetical protein